MANSLILEVMLAGYKYFSFPFRKQPLLYIEYECVVFVRWHIFKQVSFEIPNVTFHQADGVKLLPVVHKYAYAATL